jgi:hypothetical protein
MEEEDEEELEYGRRKRKVTFMPSPGRQFFRSALVDSRTEFFSITRHDAHDFLPRSLAKGRALDHGTSKNGDISLRRILDNPHSQIPGLWPLFGS